MFEDDAADTKTQNTSKTPHVPREKERDGGLVAARAAAAMLERVAGLHLPELPEGEKSGRLKLYLESVEDLAGGIRRDLEGLSDEPTEPNSLVGAALRGADLATLAACALPELPSRSPAYPLFEACTRLSSAATRSLALEYESLVLSDSREDGGGYEARDLRGAKWRADLAVRQVDEMSREES